MRHANVKVHTNELSDRSEDRDHIQETADDKKPDSDCTYKRRWTDYFGRRYTGNPQSKK